MIWNSKSLREALGVKIADDIKAGKLQFNSQDVERGDLFIALVTNNDGHQYVEHALAKGAAAVIISKDIQDIDQKKVIRVADTKQALMQLANYKRENAKAKFIGITGSTGKTSTKEAMKLILEPYGRVFASRGNFNNYLGLQINLASMPNDVEYSIFEMGMNHKDEISELSKLLKPNIAIITNVSEAHIEFFDSLEEIVAAKSEIFNGMHLAQSVAIIPAMEEKIYLRIKHVAEENKVLHIYSFGKAGSSDLYLVNYIAQDGKLYLKYKGHFQRKPIEFEFNMPILPKFQCENFAPCLLTAMHLNPTTTNLNLALQNLKKFKLMEGRGKVLELSINNKNYTIICDHYNASPASMKASLEHFAELNYPKKILVIGDMLELGSKAEELHLGLVPFIINTHAQKILLVGKTMQLIAKQLSQSLNISHFNTVEQLIEKLPTILDADALILIKASNGMKFSKILNYFSTGIYQVI